MLGAAHAPSSMRMAGNAENGMTRRIALPHLREPYLEVFITLFPPCFPTLKAELQVAYCGAETCKTRRKRVASPSKALALRTSMMRPVSSAT